ncbi:MAG: cupin domain-containing protein [Thermoleophilia bacterium]|nr:cupin domain-containing protein [Thermoleophilia bacterium]
MIIQPVILAGGSGTRLWPASRQSHPKQLLALVGDHTFLQETALRLRTLGEAAAAEAARDGAPAAKTAAGAKAGPAPGGALTVAEPIVVTSEDYRFMVADQLRDVGVTAPRIVLEPVGRNTAPALTVAALLPNGNGAGSHDPGDAGAADPVLLVAPSDHLIRDVPAFLAAVAEGAAQAESGLLVTFGIVPDRPETGYGYIRVDGPLPGASTACVLAGFTEKPDAATAADYLGSGDYLWNSGIFMVKRSVWLAAIERYRPDILDACRKALEGRDTDGLFVRMDADAFAACPADSIDYAVMERVGAAQNAAAAGAATPAAAPPQASAPGGAPAQAVVVPLDAGWSDVGAWGALWAVCPHDDSGNVAQGDVILEDTRDTLVHADSRLVTVLGADGLVVVETADAVLVASKDKTEDLKRLVAHVHDGHAEITIHHRRIHRPWGRFDSVDSGERFQVKHIVVSPGASLSLQLHHHRAEHWVVVRGVAEVTCGDKTFRLSEDESTYVPLGTPHRLANPGPEPLEIIEVQSGDYLGEDDIVRLDDVYGRLDERN